MEMTVSGLCSHQPELKRRRFSGSSPFSLQDLALLVILQSKLTVSNEAVETAIVGRFLTNSRCVQALINQNQLSLLLDSRIDLGKVTQINLSRSAVQEKQVDQLCQSLPGLTRIDLSQTNLSGRQLFTSLGRCQKLQCLSLSHTRNWYRFRQWPSPSFTALRILDVSNTKPIAQKLKQLLRSAPNLLVLRADWSNFTIATMRHIASACPRLCSLRVRGCSKIDANALHFLSPLSTSLTALDVSHCERVDDQAIKTIVDDLTELTQLDLAGCIGATDRVARCFAHQSLNLRKLTLDYCRITDRGVSKIVATCSRLDYLSICGCQEVIGRYRREGLYVLTRKTRMDHSFSEELSTVGT